MSRIVGLIGAGRRAPWHCAAWVDCDGVGDILLAEPDDDRRAELVEPWGIIIEDTSDWRGLVDDDRVDIVDVCAPAPVRADICRAALEAGKHVICEGPAALGPGAFDDLAAVSRPDSRLFVCIPHLMIPANRRVMQFITDGEAGEVSLGTVQVAGDGADRIEYPAWPGMPGDATAPILADCIHDALAILQAWMGEIVSVSAFSSHTRPGTPPPDCTVSLRTAAGALGQVTVTYRAGADVWREERRVFAENGSLVVRDDPEDELPLMTFVEGMFQSIPVHNPPYIRRHATMEALWDVLESIECDEQPQATVGDARGAVRAMAAAARSLASGQAVAVR